MIFNSYELLMKGHLEELVGVSGCFWLPDKKRNK